MAEFDTVAIVGVGLIGGSIGLALRERGLAREVVGIGREAKASKDLQRTNAPRRETSLEAALRLGAVDRTTTILPTGVQDAQLIVVCTPVDTIAEFVVQAAAACPKDALITDAGSTKDSIVHAADAVLSAHRAGPRFVGSHPLAGDHRSGPEFARADLFEGRTVVVTPSRETRTAAVIEVTGFWESLGGKVTTMAPAVHDAALAATSHLPHLIAATLAAATPEETLPLAASGWRDTTRIAGADPELWRAIFATNRQPVLDALDRFEKLLNGIRNGLALGNHEPLLQVLERAKAIKSDHDALGD